MVASLYAGLLALIFIALSINVIKGRRQFHLAIGDAGNEELKRRIRAQANFAEYTAFFLVLLGYAEHNNLPSYAIHCLGIIFIAGRIMHAYSLLKAERCKDGQAHSRWRVRSMICTLNCIAFLSAILIIQWLASLFN